MADKELKKMSRPELIEIIYELQKNEQEILEQSRIEKEKLSSEVCQLQEKLNDREIKIEQAGSIAEAAMQLNDIFSVAQKAADEYLSSVYAAHATAQVRADHILEAAQIRAEEIVAEALQKKVALEKEAEEILNQATMQRNLIESQTEQIVQNKWEQFEKKVQELLSTHRELSDLMRRG